MKKTNHPRWPEPLLGMAPIRLRPMGWLDDLLPMRPPSLWRDISVQRGLQWSPNLADLSWLFAAYSMLGVELPMPRIQHRTHISSSRQPVRRRRTNARTLLQQKGRKKKNISIPKWGGTKTVHIAPSEKREGRVDHAARIAQPQRRNAFASGSLPAFQWKGDGLKRPQTTSPGNLQLVKRIVNQETPTLRPKRPQEVEEIVGRTRPRKQTFIEGDAPKIRRKQETRAPWKLKPRSTIRLPKETEKIRIQRTALNPLTPVLQQRQNLPVSENLRPTRPKNEAIQREETVKTRKPTRSEDVQQKRGIKRPRLSTEIVQQLRFSAPIRANEEAGRPKIKKFSLSPPPIQKRREWLERISPIEQGKTRKPARSEDVQQKRGIKRPRLSTEIVQQLRFSAPIRVEEETGRPRVKKVSLSPPPIQKRKEWLERLAPIGQEKSRKNLRSPTQDLTSLRPKKTEDIFEDGPQRRRARDTEFSEEIDSPRGKEPSTRVEGKRLRQRNFLISPERAKQFRFSVPEIQETIQPKRIRPQISLSPLPLLRKDSSPEQPEGIRTKPRKVEIAPAEQPTRVQKQEKPSVDSAQRKKVPNLRLTPERIKKLKFSVPEAPITRPKPKGRRQLSLALPKNIFRPQREESKQPAPAQRRASFSIQNVLRKRAAQIFQREESSPRKTQIQQQETVFSPTRNRKPSILQPPPQGKSREEISWGTEEERRSVQTPNLARPVLLKKIDPTASSSEQLPVRKGQKRTEEPVSETKRTRLQADRPVYAEKKRIQRQVEEGTLSVPRKPRTISKDFQNIRKLRVEREQDIAQPPKFSVKEFQIVRTLRSRKEKSLQVVPPIFQNKRISPLQPETAKDKGRQPTRILANKELPIVRKPTDSREEQVRKPKVSPTEARVDAPVRKAKIRPETEEIKRRKIEVEPEVLQKLKKVKEFSFREAPQFSKRRQRLIRELQSGNQTRLGSSLRAIEKEIQIVRKQQEKEESIIQKRAPSPKEEIVTQQKRKSISLRRVAWPSRSKSNLLRHFELKRVAKRKEKAETVQHVPQAVHNFFSAPSTGKPQKRSQSPLLSLQAGTLVFPTPDSPTEERRTPRKAETKPSTPSIKKSSPEPQVQEEKRVRKKRSFPEAYVAQKTAYRRAFSPTGTRGRLRPQLRKEKDAVQKTSTKRQIPALVQTPLAWRSVWVEREQAPSAKPQKNVGLPEAKRDRKSKPEIQQEIAPSKVIAAESIKAERQIKANKTKVRREMSPKIGRYRGLEREAAVFWTRERTMGVPPVVLQGLKKQEADSPALERSPKKKILFSSEVQKTKTKRAKTAISAPKQTQLRQKRTPTAQNQARPRKRREYSIQELNWKPKRLAFQQPEQQRVKTSRPSVSAPAQKASRKQRSFPIIENWRKPPVFSNPLQTDAAPRKRSALGGPQRERVQARSISANIVFQPPPSARKEEAQFSPQVSKAKRERLEQDIPETRRKPAPASQPVEITQKKKTTPSSSSGILRKRAKGYLRPDISVPRSFLSSMSPSTTTPAKKSTIRFSGSVAQERQVQFYRQAQQQTFLRPEQRPLDVQQIETSMRRKKESPAEIPQARKQAGRAAPEAQSPAQKRRTQYQAPQRGRALSSRVFRAMEQVVGKKKPLAPSVQAERNFLRTAALEGGLPPERIVRKEAEAETVTPKKKKGISRSIISPTRNPRHPFLSRAQTRPKNSFPRIESTASTPEIYIAPEAATEPLAPKAKTPQEEQNIEIIRKKRKISSSRKPVAPPAIGLGREIGVFLRPKKQIVIEEEEIQEKPKGLRPDQVSKDSDVFFIDPSGNLLQGEKATKRMKELGYVRSDPKKETPPPPQSQGLPTSYSWEADPKVVEMAMAEVQKQIKKEEKPRVIRKKVQPKRVISEMTEEELFTILTALTTSSPEAQEILRDVRMKVEEYFDYERFRKI